MGVTQTTNMLPVLEVDQYDLIYNCASLGLASMMASTAFFFLRMPSFHERYRAALCFTGLVTFIAMYHYFRIFNSFEAAYTPCFRSEAGEINYNLCDADKFKYQPTGIAFNDAYRYVDWLLTVPLLLIEIVLVMDLPQEETTRRCFQLGVSSALMIANGYPGESSGDPARSRQGCRQVGLLGNRLLVVHIPYRLPLPDVLRHRFWHPRPQRWCHDCSPSGLHSLGHHLQVRCWLPRLPHRPQQVSARLEPRVRQHPCQGSGHQ